MLARGTCSCSFDQARRQTRAVFPEGLKQTHGALLSPAAWTQIRAQCPRWRQALTLTPCEPPCKVQAFALKSA